MYSAGGVLPCACMSGGGLDFVFWRFFILEESWGLFVFGESGLVGTTEDGRELPLILDCRLNFGVIGLLGGG